MLGLDGLRTAFAGLKRAQYQSIGTTDSFSPMKILIQIVLLQCFYYITAGIIAFAVSVLLGLNFQFEWIFSWEFVSLENTLGLTLIGIWLFDAFICVVFMTFVIGRSKLAWDFALTVHAINVVVVWAFSGKFPTGIVWWALQIVSSILLVILSTYTTRWKELRDTFFEGLADGEITRPAIEMNDLDV